VVDNWTFLTSHARVLLCIAHDPGVRLRDIAASLGITEGSAYGIVTDLAKAGYVVKQKDGRRNRYQIQAHLPLPEPTRHERTVGEVLALLAGTDGSAATDADRPHLPPPPARQNATSVTAPSGKSPRPETASQVLPAGNRA
jgi:MarR family